jgi:hypothetical protein
MIVAMRKALQLIRAFRGHPFFPYVIYVCVPFVIYPFWSMLVFGSYRVDFPMMLGMAGILRLMDKLRPEPAVAAENRVMPQVGQFARRPMPAFAPARGGQA